MATPSRVQLSLTEHPEFYLPGITAESAKKASELLQENHEQHHIFFNKDGFHNHIAHHLLTIYALAAPPHIIQYQYDHNKSYQRPAVSLEDSVMQDMRDPEKFNKYLGDEKYYHDFLIFFQDEMESKGWENVLNEYLFKGDERADDMLVRMFAGFLHPIIHLGFGVEFHQPAIIAEALAQAAIHSDWMKPFLIGAEKAAKENNVTQSKTLVELLDAIKADEKVAKAPRWDDGNKLRDGIVKRVPEEMIKYASQYVVHPEELEEKTAEMTNAAIYYTGAAQHPPHQIKFDFYYMHCTNSSIFFSAFLSAPWLSTASKRRLLEWKGRNDLAMYASRRAPDLLLDEITNYKPKEPTADKTDPWGPIFERVGRHEDDGHAAKLVRALAHGQVISAPYEEKDGFRIKGGMWLQLGHMAIDSVEAGEPHWVRSAGFEEAWEKIPERPRL
ncbi:hypothetical protein W97_02215 [Coniosporium apollinis CBS 100218]|uniref:HypA-like protein n=1 Tax=Coniosporium apollinis (strain CBS 100218) TaxID=1168221 RepID=R7YME7_CONA1|nr:uncharacterized protein W97_02215 [Coniosporium apollinis CBS 100218]EON62989.1 hypothetical protein W97_02215 [Coniosporium apollinis CBS 100218]